MVYRSPLNVSEEDVGGTVQCQRCRRGEDGREAASADRCQALILAELVSVAGGGQAPDVKRPGQVGLPPGAAPIAGVGEPGVGGQGGIAGPVVAKVVPGDPDRAVRIDGDRGVEGERGLVDLGGDVALEFPESSAARCWAGL
jgi:hypothetical protein